MLTKWQTAGVMIYAVAFPLSGLVGGGIQTFFLFATAPFLPIGYIVGGLTINIFGSTKAYPFGLAVAIFIQVWFLLVLLNQRKAK